MDSMSKCCRSHYSKWTGDELGGLSLLCGDIATGIHVGPDDIHKRLFCCAECPQKLWMSRDNEWTFKEGIIYFDKSPLFVMED